MTALVSESTTGTPVSKQSRTDAFVTMLYRYAMLLVLAALLVIATFTYDNFLAWGNFQIILVQNAGLGIIAVGVTMLMVTGAFDLSVVPVFVLGAAVYASMADVLGWGLALLAAVVAGAVTGVINGFIVAKIGVNSFIATLATASVFSGIVLSWMGTDLFSLTTPSPRLLGTGSVAGIPTPIILLVVVFLIGQLVLGSTAYGRRLMTVGGSEHAARLSGLRVERLRVTAYAIVGVCACLAGVVFVARLGTLQATQLTNSAPLLLDAIAIVVVGGTSLYGGDGAVWRTAIGLLIFGVLDNVIAGVNASSATEQIVKGAVVLSRCHHRSPFTTTSRLTARRRIRCRLARKAQTVATLDVMSDGRFVYGIGIGWMKAEYDVLNVPFANRGRRTNEYIRIMKQLWSGDAGPFTGEFYSHSGAVLKPLPVQKPHPMLTVGGEGAPAFRRLIGLDGDGLHGTFKSSEAYRRDMELLETMMAAVGRSRDGLWNTMICTSEDVPRALADPAALAALEDLGVKEIVFAPKFSSADEAMRETEHIADQMSR